MADEDDMEDIARELEAAGQPTKAERVPGTPFIHRPDELDLRPGSLCWLDGSRVCGPDCMAFNGEEGVDKSGVPIDTPNKCLHLKYAGQQGSAALATIAHYRNLRKVREDAARNEVAPTPPVPPVGGGKT